MKNYINGTWTSSETGRTFPNLNPADNRDVIGEFPLSSSADIASAVDAADKAFN
ncbi:MAG: aldehyde dehydrogenase family protein, partial [Ignavibacteria bacterium]